MDFLGCQGLCHEISVKEKNHVHIFKSNVTKVCLFSNSIYLINFLQLTHFLAYINKIY